MVSDNRTALDYLLAEQVVCAIAMTSCCTWSNNPGIVETQIQEISKQATWLKKVDASSGAFFNLLDTNWFGSWGPWLSSTLSLLVLSP